LDAVVEDEHFAREMEEMYLQDLTNATEVVLDAKLRLRAPGEPPHPHPVLTSGGGSGGRAAAGAIRIGNAIGAVFTDRRVLERRVTHHVDGSRGDADVGVSLCHLPACLSLSAEHRFLLDNRYASLQRLQTAPP
jgi:hypothetical protein